MEVNIKRMASGVARMSIENVLFVTVYAAYDPRVNSCALSLHLTGEQCCELCNAIRDLRDYDHNYASAENEARAAQTGGE